MIQHLIGAIGYNVIAIPFAGRSLLFNMTLLNPAAAAVLMAISTIEVAINASQLKI